MDGLNTVVSAPSSRARPRTAVSEPSVTMKGGRRRSAISAPLMTPKPSPVRTAAGSQSAPSSGSLDMVSPAIAAAARIEPTERSMPPVRMTKVMPAAVAVSALSGLSCIELLHPRGECHDFFLVQRRCRAALDFAGNMPRPHDDDAVADTDDLGQIGRDHKDRSTGFGEIVDDRID